MLQLRHCFGKSSKVFPLYWHLNQNEREMRPSCLRGDLLSTVMYVNFWVICACSLLYQYTCRGLVLKQIYNIIYMTLCGRSCQLGQMTEHLQEPKGPPQICPSRNVTRFFIFCFPCSQLIIEFCFPSCIKNFVIEMICL